ncbi:MAG: hypothetical protein R3E89_11310 [Thiolinea sp.]
MSHIVHHHNNTLRASLAFLVMAGLIVLVGLFQSWSLALAILNLCLISAVMALGVNIQWGYAGLFNVGIMGFAGLGGLAAILTSMPPVQEAWAAGGINILLTALALAATIALALYVHLHFRGRKLHGWLLTLVVIGGIALIRYFYAPAVSAVEAVNPASTGYLGGWGCRLSCPGWWAVCWRRGRRGWWARCRWGCGRIIWRLPPWGFRKSLLPSCAMRTG